MICDTSCHLPVFPPEVLTPRGLCLRTLWNRPEQIKSGSGIVLLSLLALLPSSGSSLFFLLAHTHSSRLQFEWISAKKSDSLNYPEIVKINCPPKRESA